LAYGVDVVLFEKIGDLKKVLMRGEFDLEP
jgi:hypothetical protein